MREVLTGRPFCPTPTAWWCPDLPAGPEVLDADPGPAPHQPAAGQCISVPARGADAPHWAEPRAAEASGGLPGPVPKWSPQGAKQEVSALDKDTHRHACSQTRMHTHTHARGQCMLKVSSWETCQSWVEISCPLGSGDSPYILGKAFICSCIHSSNQQLFTENILNAQYWARCVGYNTEQGRPGSCPLEG